jgi:hypothetical protein
MNNQIDVYTIRFYHVNAPATKGRFTDFDGDLFGYTKYGDGIQNGKKTKNSLVDICIEYINDNYENYLRQIQNNLNKDTLDKLMERLVQRNKWFLRENSTLDRGFTPSNFPLYPFINKVATHWIKRQRKHHRKMIRNM